MATGANMINKDLTYIGVSGDGDTASIGIGQFIHAIRRNLNMIYIIENNGVYGLTKGQYSATAEVDTKKKKGAPNEVHPIDLCAIAINLGCTFVARSFSSSKKQLTTLVKAAMSHKGMAVLDIISPCVTFNNNEESLKSYGYVKDNETELHSLGYIPHFEPIQEIEIPAGSYHDIELHDGSVIRLETISEDHDPADAVAALAALHKAEASKQHVTGLLYFNPDKPTADEEQNLSSIPLNELPESLMRPSPESLQKILTAKRG